MAVSRVLADRALVHQILRALSDMRISVRLQSGPEEPVQFQKFPPTLVPSILVNHLWADEGTSILWANYPFTGALLDMDPDRRQYYADKVQKMYLWGMPAGYPYLRPQEFKDLRWPELRTLELKIDDLAHHLGNLRNMLHAKLEDIEIAGLQTDGGEHFSVHVLPFIFKCCPSLKSICLKLSFPEADDVLSANVLISHLPPTLKQISLPSVHFVDKDVFFWDLAQKPGLEHIDIDLPPGLSPQSSAYLKQLHGPDHTLFKDLNSLFLVAYPEFSTPLSSQLQSLQVLELAIARIPENEARVCDYNIFEDLFAALRPSQFLRRLSVLHDIVAIDFPSETSLPNISGAGLVQLGISCPKLTDLELATRPVSSGINASHISSTDFDLFCENLSGLKTLSLQFHPLTTAELSKTALQSVGKHCREIEVLQLRIALDLPSLPVPDSIPWVLLGRQGPAEAEEMPDISDLSLGEGDTFGRPLFPRLSHLALARPDTFLGLPEREVGWPPELEDEAVTPTSLESARSSLAAAAIADLDREETLVLFWAHPLLIHFPSIEVLEAWGNWSGDDLERLKYFLPREGLMATTWDFLTGKEQDLCDVDPDEIEGLAEWE